MTNEAVLEAESKVEVVQAVFVDKKPVKSASSIRLSFDVPNDDYHDLLLSAFLGAASGDSSKWVEIRRVNRSEKPNSSTVAKNATVHEHGDYARKLYTSGFFLHQEVLESLGSDDDFLGWIRLQPSCVSGEFSEYVNGEGRCVAAHVRRAANSGIADKPKFSAVPLTQTEHDMQHKHGERNLLKGNEATSVQTAKDWFWDQRCKKVTEWAKMRLKAKLSHDHCTEFKSLADIDPIIISAWAEAHNLTNFLPRE